ncbi:MAG: alanine--tRNA ligase [Candidatus Diapherotrites archaeon]
MISSKTVRDKYLQYFTEKGHAVIPSASLIPENDPSVLFTTAGMHPLVPYLLGEKHPVGKRLADSQKCVRTTDIDMVGDQWHLSFFEMLGNWSLGDYFKKDAIEYSFEFLTSKKWIGFDSKRIFVSVFEGDQDAPRDEESAKVWKSLGIPEEHIFFFPKSENWWGLPGKGPCGPCTEIFYDTGKPYCSKGKGAKVGQCNPSCGCGKFSELGNNVFMEYFRREDGSLEKLEQKNVDFGGGLERIVAIANGLDNVFETDLFRPIFDKVGELASNKNLHSQRIVCDHLKAAVFILGDEKGIVPSNVDQGYVLRRLIRRAVRHGRILGIRHNFCAQVGKEVVKLYASVFPEISKNAKRIESELEKEETKFRQTLEKGLTLTKKFSADAILVSGKTAFDLYQSYGFPIEMTEEIAAEKGLKVDLKAFHALLEEHQKLSRKGAEQKFKGGLADSQHETVQLHTAAHLLVEALRRVVGKHVTPKGANITAERLRFDFSNPKKLSAEQLKKVEELVNEQIRNGLEVKMEILPLEEAKKSGAYGVFDSKYGEKVKVYTIWNPVSREVFSKEICGGPHVENLKELGSFKILKEESVSAGVRRIKAVLE